MVTGVTYRNPALLAKEVTALDVLSGGRAVLGIGAAWFEAEHDALGFAFPPLSERFDRLEEALIICRAMFTEDAPSFDGRYYRIKGACQSSPPRAAWRTTHPHRRGWRASHTAPGGRARPTPAISSATPTHVRHKLEVLDRHCQDVQRDPATITKTRLGTLIIAETSKDADRKLRNYQSSRGSGRERTAGHGDRR
jgi:alkanesulfonate monooxygenase SsuD/methylene tetrahydromethanopterin reductase-like flavin-dependent oxidoreductase (luciferase family)